MSREPWHPWESFVRRRRFYKIKPRNTRISSGSPIPCLVEWGGLRLVIGRTASKVTEPEALGYIGGYTIVNDISIPNDSYYRPPIKHKCRDGFCRIGPRVAAWDPHPDAVEIRIRINGELRCSNTTANLVRPIPRLIADITEFMTFAAGEVLLVGEPDGAPEAGPGDHVRVEIDGIGWIENPVAEEALG